MRVKITNAGNAAGLIDPHTKRSPFIDPATGEVIPVADVPENSFWTRRLLAGEVVRVEESTKPVGNEPIAPLTTRRS